MCYPSARIELLPIRPLAQGKGVMQEAVFVLSPSPNLSPKGERNMKGEGERNRKARAGQRGCGRQDRSSDST